MTMPQQDTPQCTDHHASELLPWLANNTLVAPESDRVQGHVANCSSCCEELKELRAAQRQLDSYPDLDVIPGPPPTSIMQRIDAYERNRWLHDLVITPLRLCGSTVWRPFSDVQPIVKWALAAQTALVAILLTILFSPLLEDGVRFHTASDPGRGPLPTREQVRIVLDTALTLEQFHAILAEIDGQIVAGPSAWGVYTVAIGTTGLRAADGQMEVTQHLRLQPGIIFAEPVAVPRP